MKLLDFFEAKYATIRLLGKSPKTHKLYSRSIDWFSASLNSEAELEDLTDENLAKHLQCILHDGWSRATASKERAQLIAIANFASRRGYLSWWIDIPTIRMPERIPEAWTIEDLKVILHACKRQTGGICGVSASLWWTSLHLALWDTGERIGAMLQAEFGNLRDDSLVLKAETRKNQTRDKIYGLSNDCMVWIAMSQRPTRKLIWPWEKSEAQLYYDYGKLLTTAGLPASRHCKFHRMRRSVATHLKAAGIDPQGQLDHASSRTTQKYLDPRILTQTNPRDVLGSIID